MPYTFLSGPSPEPNFDSIFPPIKLYQVCIMTLTGKYLVRCVYVNEQNDIIRTKIYRVTKYQLMELLDSLPDNVYTTHPMYDFRDIMLPSDNDILLARSSLMQKQCNNGNYGKF